MDNLVPIQDQGVLDEALAAVRALGLKIRVEPPPPKPGRVEADAFIGIQHDGKEVLYAADVHRALRPATLGVTLLQLERLAKPALLVTDHVTPELADELKARRVAFIDTAGNAYLEQPNLLIWVKGQKAAPRQLPPRMGRAFQPTGLQVVFTLLCNPQAVNLPYRELATMAGVAHGTVGWVMPDLQKMGFVGDLAGKRGTRRIFDGPRLITLWADAYARHLRPRLLLGRYYIPTLQGWRDWNVETYGALWGGEPGGAILTDYLRPGELTIYAEKLPAMLALKQKFLKAPEPGRIAVVEIRRRFWNFPGETLHPNTVPPLLVYADLLATGDGRCIETAKMVYDGYVARLFAED